MLPKNKLADKMLKKLKVYRGAEHPHEAQPVPCYLKIIMSAKTAKLKNLSPLDAEKRTARVRIKQGTGPSSLTVRNTRVLHD